MGSLSLVHWLVVLGIALLLFGNRLPGLGKSLGEGIRNFKSGLGNEDGEEGDKTNANSTAQNGGNSGSTTSQKQITGQAQTDTTTAKRENSHQQNS
ncbi:MAG: twin-arginine translocase TatA/TatE family subunit [Silvanigrellales bacterium]|jgi:sec-independent protein translocase protein TatA|nr:twin-arginine translocase TatA/TatE family subunit [Silvanigrellales bacterium]